MTDPKKDPSHFLFGSPKKTIEAEKTKSTFTLSGAASFGAQKTDKTLSEKIKSRGYAKRTFNSYSKTCLDILKSLEEDPTNQTQKNLLTKNFAKASQAFEKFELEHGQVVSLAEEKDVDKQMEEFETLFEEFSQLQKRIGASSADLDLLTEYNEQVEKPKPSQRFKPQTQEPEIPEEARYFLNALQVNYKITDHVEIFDGKDILRYIGWRHQIESADRILTQKRCSNFEKYLEIRKTLRAEPLKLVMHLPNVDNSYEKSLDILDNFYLRPQISINQVTKKLNELEKMGSTIDSIKAFHAELLTIYHSMMALNLDTDNMGLSLFLASVTPKLNNQTLREWCKLTERNKDDSALGHSCNVDNLLDLVLFNLKVTESFATVQASGTKPNPIEKTKHKPNYYKPPTLPSNFFVQGTAANSMGQNKNFKPCTICGKNGHPPLGCSDLKNKTTLQLFDIAQSKKLCKLCFLPSHKSIECRKKDTLSCSICHKPHNSVLHLTQMPTRNPSKQANISSRLVMKTHLTYFSPKLPTPISPLIKVKACHPNGQGRQIKIICLLDSGSNVNFITTSVYKMLSLPSVRYAGPRKCELIQGITCEVNPNEVKIRLTALDNSYKCNIIATVIPHIAVEKTPLNFKQDDYPYLNGYKLTMDLPRTNEVTVHCLLGEPCFSAIVTGKERSCSCEQAPITCPSLWMSTFGPFISGAYETKSHFLLKTLGDIKES